MNNIKTFYIRNFEKKRDLTIVSNLIEIDGKNVIKCGWAFRSNHDQFKKKEGRSIASERMNSNDPNYSTTFEVGAPSFKDIAGKILETILNRESTPRKYIDDIQWDYNYFVTNFPSRSND